MDGELGVGQGSLELGRALGSAPQSCARQVAIHTLWNIRIVVLAKPEHENRISHICTDNVKTGIANTLGKLGEGQRLPRSPPAGMSLSWDALILGSALATWMKCR